RDRRRCPGPPATAYAARQVRTRYWRCRVLHRWEIDLGDNVRTDSKAVTFPLSRPPSALSWSATLDRGLAVRMGMEWRVGPGLESAATRLGHSLRPDAWPSAPAARQLLSPGDPSCAAP